VGLISFSSLTMDAVSPTMSCIRIFLEGEGLSGAVNCTIFLGVPGTLDLVSGSEGGGVESRTLLLELRSTGEVLRDLGLPADFLFRPETFDCSSCSDPELSIMITSPSLLFRVACGLVKDVDEDAG
jgi:hypothetical protein